MIRALELPCSSVFEVIASMRCDRRKIIYFYSLVSKFFPDHVQTSKPHAREEKASRLHFKAKDLSIHNNVRVTQAHWHALHLYTPCTVSTCTLAEACASCAAPSHTVVYSTCIFALHAPHLLTSLYPHTALSCLIAESLSTPGRSQPRRNDRTMDGYDSMARREI